MIFDRIHEKMIDTLYCFSDKNTLGNSSADIDYVLDNANCLTKAIAYIGYLIAASVILFLLGIYSIILSFVFVLHCVELYITNRIWVNFFTYFPIHPANREEIQAWCKENCRRYYFRRFNGQLTVSFWHKSDATHFKLMSSEDYS